MKKQKAKVNNTKNKTAQFFSKIWSFVKENKVNIIMFLILLFFQQLSWTGNMLLGKDGVSLAIPLDSKIPLISQFVYVYYLTFPLVVFAFFWVCNKDKEHGWNLWLTAIISFTISGIIYLCFQTQMTKPDLTPVALSDKLLIMTWNSCKPINCFPSQHCIMAMLLFVAYYNQRKTTKTWFRVFNYICGILIIMATVFLKQHYFVDMLGSLAIILPTYIVVKTWNFGKHMENKMSELADKKEMKQALKVASKSFNTQESETSLLVQNNNQTQTDKTQTNENSVDTEDIAQADNQNNNIA